MLKTTLTKENFKEEVLEAGLPVLVDFYADWCVPCKMLAPIIEEISEEYDSVKVMKLNIDNANEIAAQFGVMSIPTVILFKNGEVDKKLVGFRSKEAIVSEFEL